MTHQKHNTRSDLDLSRQLRPMLNIVIFFCIATLSESAIAQNASAIFAPVIGEQIFHVVDCLRADPIAVNPPTGMDGNGFIPGSKRWKIDL